MVSRCMTSTSLTKGARPIRASTRASGSAQPGWMYTRIPDSTQDTASCAVTSLLRYCSIQDIDPNPFLRRNGFRFHGVAGGGTLVPQCGVVNGKMKEFVQQFHLAEDLCRMLQFSVFLQVVPKVLADQANHPYHLANGHALCRALRADFQVTAFYIGFRLAQQPFAEMAIHVIHFFGQLTVGHIGVGRALFALAITVVQAADQPVGMALDQLY